MQRVGLGGLVVLLAGCPYVSRGELEAQLDRSDEDGDGVSVGDGDCADDEPNAFPGNDEVPYDGIDNDCVDGDLVDVDGDGHSIDTDCDDNDASVFPAAVDEPYDGVNADCREGHDYDQDGDGYLVAGADPDEVAAYEAVWGSGTTPVLGTGDCNDLNRQVYPGAPDDVWYDGVDTDCDGADDYDADGDGVPLADDCLDQADASEPDADPAEVYPGADDILYDGIDADCARDNDFDGDGDGWVASGYTEAFDDYATRLGIPNPRSYDDCDDADATVHPEALELLDGVNQDCGGGGLPGDGDALSLYEGGLSWSGVRQLRAAAVDGLYVAGALADDWNGVSDAAVLLGFAAPYAFEGLPDQPLEIPQQPGEALDEAFQLAVDGDTLHVLTVDARDFGTTSTHALQYEVDAEALVSVDDTRFSFAGGSSEVLGGDIAFGDDERFVWSCRDQALQVSELPAQVSAVAQLPETAVACAASPDDPTVALVCSDTACTWWGYTPGLLAPVGPTPLDGELAWSLRTHGSLLVAITDNAVRVEGAESFVAYDGEAVAADVVVDGGVAYVLVATASGGLELHHGKVGASLEVVDLLPAGAVSDVALSIDARGLMVLAVVDDAVQWGFYGR